MCGESYNSRSDLIGRRKYSFCGIRYLFLEILFQYLNLKKKKCYRLKKKAIHVKTDHKSVSRRMGRIAEMNDDDDKARFIDGLKIKRVLEVF